MSATNKDTADTSNSTASFISAFITGIVVLSALLSVWLVLRNRDRRIYQPRTFLPPNELRAPELPSSPIGWFKTVASADDQLVLRVQGPDTYFFLRFIRLGIFIFAGFFIVTWVILMPIAGTGSNGLKGMNRFTFGNIAPDQQLRLIAYFLVAILLTLYVLYLVDAEYKHYRAIRQEWLASDLRSSLPEARTVVLTNVPEANMSTEGIQQLVGEHGTVERVWISRKIGKLEKTLDERDKEVLTLENKLGGLLALATKNHRKNKLPDSSNASESNDLISRYVAKKKQPTHKRGFLGLLGKKVDTLHDSPAYIQEKEQDLKAQRAEAHTLPMGDAAFVRFATKEQAHAFVAHLGQGGGVGKAVKAVKAIKGEVNVMPENVIWENLKFGASKRAIMKIVSWSLTIGLIIIWAIPVAFVGFVSNINTLTTTVKFLSFLNSLPSAVIGIIQGILPPVLLAVLFMLLPKVLRFFVKMQGIVLKSEVEKGLFVRFWLFQVIHGFLIVTLAAGLIDALKNINETLPELPTLLANKLPKSSTFFLQYLALYALTSFGLSVSRVVPFIVGKISFLAGKTPRKVWKFNDKMVAIALATTWPPVALLACVGIVYSCIQPIITLFGLFTFCVLYVMYKYVLIWVADQPDSLETGGEFMRKAIVTVFVSLYLELICLCGLFFLSTDAAGNRSKPGLAGGALMAALIVLVAVFHWVSTHKRYNARECHFLHSALTGRHQSHESKHPITGAGDNTHAFPPGHKESAQAQHATGFLETAFDHPALWKPAQVVWVANDTLGIGRSEVDRLNSQKVAASTEHATMDADGKIDVTRAAPDEPWGDGIDKL